MPDDTNASTRAGLRARDAAGDEARLVAVSRVSDPPVITRMDCVAARIHSTRSTMRASGHLAALVEAGHFAHRHLGVAATASASWSMTWRRV